MDISQYLKDPTEFAPPERLDGGGFGDVFIYTEKKSGKQYAGKIYKNENYENVIFFLREIHICTINYPTILQLKGWSVIDSLLIFTDFMEKGSLSRYITKNKLTPDQKQIILFGISKGLEIFHSYNVLVRDLKPENVLLDDNLHPIINDFNLSKFTFKGEIHSRQCGTIRDMAPELLKEDPSFDYGPEIDVYSFGNLIYSVIVNKVFKTGFNFKQSLDKNEMFKKVEYKVFKKLINDCLMDDKNNRPTSAEISRILENNHLPGVNDNNFKNYVKFLNNYKPAKMVIKTPEKSDNWGQIYYEKGMIAKKNNKPLEASNFLKIAMNLRYENSEDEYYKSLVSLGKYYEDKEQGDDAIYYYQLAVDEGNVIEACEPMIKLSEKLGYDSTLFHEYKVKLDYFMKNNRSESSTSVSTSIGSTETDSIISNSVAEQSKNNDEDDLNKAQLEQSNQNKDKSDLSEKGPQNSFLTNQNEVQNNATPNNQCISYFNGNTPNNNFIHNTNNNFIHNTNNNFIHNTNNNLNNNTINIFNNNVNNNFDYNVNNNFDYNVNNNFNYNVNNNFNYNVNNIFNNNANNNLNYNASNIFNNNANKPDFTNYYYNNLIDDFDDIPIIYNVPRIISIIFKVYEVREETDHTKYIILDKNGKRSNLRVYGDLPNEQREILKTKNKWIVSPKVNCTSTFRYHILTVVVDNPRTEYFRFATNKELYSTGIMNLNNHVFTNFQDIVKYKMVNVTMMDENWNYMMDENDIVWTNVIAFVVDIDRDNATVTGKLYYKLRVIDTDSNQMTVTVFFYRNSYKILNLFRDDSLISKPILFKRVFLNSYKGIVCMLIDQVSEAIVLNEISPNYQLLLKKYNDSKNEAKKGTFYNNVFLIPEERLPEHSKAIDGATYIFEGHFAIKNFYYFDIINIDRNKFDGSNKEDIKYPNDAIKENLMPQICMFIKPTDFNNNINEFLVKRPKIVNELLGMSEWEFYNIMKNCNSFNEFQKKVKKKIHPNEPLNIQKVMIRGYFTQKDNKNVLVYVIEKIYKNNDEVQNDLEFHERYEAFDILGPFIDDIYFSKEEVDEGRNANTILQFAKNLKKKGYLKQALKYYKKAADLPFLNPYAQFKYGKSLYNAVPSDENGKKEGLNYIIRAAKTYPEANYFLQRIGYIEKDESSKISPTQI